MSRYYILDGHTPVAVDNAAEWSKRFEHSDRSVAQLKHGDVHVSTVFLGIDHSFGDGPPLLFETMIFGGEHDEFQDRCSTWDEAEAMHKAACKKAFGQ